MRHRRKVHQLSRPADQRNALIRTLATSFFIHHQIHTTLHRAKALQEQVEHIITLAKKGNLHAIRQVNRLIYNQPTGLLMKDGDSDRVIERTVLRHIVRTVGPHFAERKGGYTRLIKAPPRRGDAAPMAVLELVETVGV